MGCTGGRTQGLAATSEAPQHQAWSRRSRRISQRFKTFTTAPTVRHTVTSQASLVTYRRNTKPVIRINSPRMLAIRTHHHRPRLLRRRQSSGPTRGRSGLSLGAISRSASATARSIAALARCRWAGVISLSSWATDMVMPSVFHWTVCYTRRVPQISEIVQVRASRLDELRRLHLGGLAQEFSHRAHSGLKRQVIRRNSDNPREAIPPTLLRVMRLCLSHRRPRVGTPLPGDAPDNQRGQHRAQSSCARRRQELGEAGPGHSFTAGRLGRLWHPEILS